MKRDLININELFLKNLPYNSLSSLLEESCAKYSQNIALENFGSKLSYRELKENSDYFASYLQNNTSLKQGDRIAIQMPNLMQYHIVVLGALKAGLVIVNVNPLYTPNEMLHQLNDSNVKAVVILENFAVKLEEIIDSLKVKPEIIITTIGDYLGKIKGPIINNVLKYIKKQIPKHNLKDYIFLKNAINLGKNLKFIPLNIKIDDIAFLQYTTGSTGTPKAAMLTHRNLISNIFQVLNWMQTIEITNEEIAVSPLPLYHIFSMMSSFVLIVIGAKNILITNPRDLNSLIRVLKKSKLTFFTGVNTLFKALLKQAKFSSIDFSNCKIILGGAAPIQENVAHQWHKITKTKIIEAYGLTEASPAVSVNPIDNPRYNTVGIPFIGTEIRIIDENDRFLTPNQKGEIVIKGPQVMQGYWRQESETENTFINGWFKTGDIGVIDEDNFLTIVDRKKNIVNISGFNVYPNEIDNVVNEHPKVLEAATIGIPDEKSGEALKLFIIRKDNSLTRKEMIEFCKKKLTNYKIPKFIEFRKELPKLIIGKIDKKALKEEYLDINRR